MRVLDTVYHHLPQAVHVTVAHELKATAKANNIWASDDAVIEGADITYAISPIKSNLVNSLMLPQRVLEGATHAK